MKAKITRVGTVTGEGERRVFAGWEFEGGESGLAYEAGELKTVGGHTPDELAAVYERTLREGAGAADAPRAE